jgi:3-oxoacyl-[acyl-carrier protein] reductase
MTRALIIGGTKGIGAACARALEAAGDEVEVVGRNTPGFVTNGITHLVFCQRYRDNDDPWDGEMRISLGLTKDIIEWVKFDGDPTNSIVIISSVIARTVASEQPVGYHVAKAALEGMARYYAVNLGQKGIRTNCVSPCVVLKQENRDYYAAHPEKVELFSRINPLRRMGTSEDVANVVAWLCSPGAAYVNGVVIPVDGGVSLLNQEALARSFLKEDK